MENLLKELFDFQRFQKNKRLEALVSETESRYRGDPEGLPDEELDFVNAAGEALPMNEKNPKAVGEGKE